jgi:hypothetical protein
VSDGIKGFSRRVGHESRPFGLCGIPRAAEAKVQAPRIINASETIVDGSMCAENYHAILETVKSSIQDSLRGKGACGGAQ